MTPYSHAYCGLAAGYLLAPALEPLGIRRRLAVLATTLGALAPDVDAIWLFIKKANYSSRAWYGHHGATHSLAGAILLGCMVGVSLWLLANLIRHSASRIQTYRQNHQRNTPLALPEENSASTNKAKAAGHLSTQSRGSLRWPALLALLAAGSLGALLHLPGDLVTLSGVWGGLPLAWPLHMQRTPALGLIPWRDYFVILLALCSFGLLPLLGLLESWLTRRHMLSWPAALLSLLVLVGYIGSLPPYSDAALWHKQQQERVGPTLYQQARQIESRYIWPLFR